MTNTRTSVILCTHNPRPTYLERTLHSLRMQTHPLTQWEFLLIDNRSDTPLADIWDLSWHPRARHIREDELGLTPARLRGIKEAEGSLLIFVDDDNVLAPDYLAHAEIISQQYPNLGVFGAGRIEPEYEQPLPPELTPLVHLLALKNAPTPLWSNNPAHWRTLPVGAGLCAHRSVAEGFRRIVEAFDVNSILGRRGVHLFSGEDDIFSWAATKLGLGFGIFPELRITHLIPASRLTHRYFLRLIHDHAYSHGVLRYLLSGLPPKRIEISRRIRVLLHGIRRGIFSMKCQWAESRGEDLAARFITAHELRPLPALTLHDCRPRTAVPVQQRHELEARSTSVAAGPPSVDLSTD